MKKYWTTLTVLLIGLSCFAQQGKNNLCPYVCCPAHFKNAVLPDPHDSLVVVSKRGIILQFKKGSFAPFAIADLNLTIHDDFNYNRLINMDISSNDTTNGFVQSSVLITLHAETKDHTLVPMKPSGAVKIYVPSDSLPDDYHKSFFSGFRNERNVMEWQYESESDTMITIDSCSYQIYHSKAAAGWHIGKDVGLQMTEAQLRIKGFDNPKVYVIYKNINVIDFVRPDKKGIYQIPNNSDPFNTIVVIKANKKGKNYFTELRLSEIKEGKNIKEYLVTENYFIELKNTDIKLRLF